MPRHWAAGTDEDDLGELRRDGRRADALVASWRRIEQHLADLQKVVGSTADMDAQTLVQYRALFVRWNAAAGDRQWTLQALAQAVRAVGEHYRSRDTALAAQFG